MGKRTDAYTTAVNQYATNSTPHKNTIAQADIEIQRLWKLYPAQEILANAGKANNASQLWAQFVQEKQSKHDAMVQLQVLVRAFRKTTSEFEEAMKKKEKSLNPFKSKTSLPTAKLAIQHAKLTMDADQTLITL